jgi:hypothetical protein
MLTHVESSRTMATGLSSAQRVSTGRSQATCLVVEDDHVMLHLVIDYLREHKHPGDLGLRTR